ncbi:ADP-ribose pyrophosphatase YjhB (NUDIX family) [Stenotrophomonas maltophilia]|nr:ADP-ribose pyrophosphatase YjhB (NUDIX family) [Stenotrophomonas chelatiphaga]ROQ48412.1 ADP-ribose pyrophosphatase YjhB (NUDIX family) [Stenotrophomonas maltophilia]
MHKPHVQHFLAIMADTFAERVPDMSETVATLALLDDPLRELLRQHALEVPVQGTLADEFSTLLDDPLNPFLRERLEGHFTGSAWLVSADGQRILLTHHRKLDRWLQLGGHADGDRDLARVALNEAEEESGLSGLSLDDPAIFDLDKHWIPERHEVPGHWHYDVRFVIRAGASEAFAISEESLALAWRDIAQLAADPQADASLQRMARRWLGSDGRWPSSRR